MSMGRGTTEIFPDTGKEYYTYIQALMAYIKEPSKSLLEKVTGYAKKADDIHRKHCGCQHNLHVGINHRLRKLLSREKTEWAFLLYANFDNEYLGELKTLSPFRESALFVVDYSGGLPQMHDEDNSYLHAGAEGSFKEAIERKGFETYNGSIYFVVCDSPLLSKGEPFLIYEG